VYLTTYDSIGSDPEMNDDEGNKEYYVIQKYESDDTYMEG